MLSKNKLALFLARYRGIIILLYEIILLTFFYLLNEFNFKNHNSIVFIFLIILFPLLLSILKYLIKKENQKKYHNKKSDYDTLIKNDINKGKYFNKFISDLKNITKFVEVKTSLNNQLITLGDYKNITILIDQTKTVISIDDSHVIYQYIYGYIDDNTSKYDLKGIGKKTLDSFYNLLLKKVKSLINNEFEYNEY